MWVNVRCCVSFPYAHLRLIIHIFRWMISIETLYRVSSFAPEEWWTHKYLQSSRRRRHIWRSLTSCLLWHFFLSYPVLCLTWFGPSCSECRTRGSTSWRNPKVVSLLPWLLPLPFQVPGSRGCLIEASIMYTASGDVQNWIWQDIYSVSWFRLQKFQLTKHVFSICFQLGNPGWMLVSFMLHFIQLFIPEWELLLSYSLLG